MRPLLLFLLLTTWLWWGGTATGQAAPFARCTATELVLDNGVVQRTLQLPGPADGHFLTTRYQPVAGEFKYFLPSSPDFQFELSDSVSAGAGRWQLLGRLAIAAAQGDGAALALPGIGQEELTLKFWLYPARPVIRKSLTVKSRAAGPVRLELVDVEKFALTEYYTRSTSLVIADPDKYTACFGTGWYGYIRGELFEISPN